MPLTRTKISEKQTKTQECKAEYAFRLQAIAIAINTFPHTWGRAGHGGPDHHDYKFG